MVRWSHEEVERLKKFYPYVPRKGLELLFPNRNFVHLIDKASHIKIKRFFCSKTSKETSKLIRKELKGHEVGYVAGFIDGEGSISISTKNRKGMHPDPYLTMACIDKNAIEYIQSMIGGNMYIQTRHGPSTFGSKTLYYLKITNMHQLYKTLMRLKSYLVIKKRRAELVSEYIKERFFLQFNSEISDRQWEIFDELQKEGYKPRTKFISRPKKQNF